MNSKHIACAIVAIAIVLLIQLTLWVQNARTKMQREAGAAQQAEVAASMQLAQEQNQLGQLRAQSVNLIAFLNTWQPHFKTIDTPQSAEVNFTMRVKDSNLVNLAQRFDQTAVRGNTSIPSAMRAHLTFEDDYARLLNWLGRLESEMPTVRVSNVKMARGTRPNDLRMELTLEQPLLKQ